MIADDVRRQTKHIFQNIEAIFAAMDDALFAKRLGGFLVWKQMYHLIHSLDKNLVDPATYVEPTFHERNHDIVYLDDGRALPKDELYDYYLGVRDKVERYLDGLDEGQLVQIHPFHELRVSGLELILAQLRHVFYHVGYLHCCLKLEMGETPEYIGLYVTKPA